jgi:tetratricopeptide (TPR) repeat protein
VSEPEPASTLSRDPEQRLARLWRRGERPELRRFLAEVGPLSSRELAGVLAVDQRERWLAGERVPAETYLRDYPALQEDAELALELVYGEFLLREEMGEAPALADYVRRFPQYAARLAQQAEVHQALAATSAEVLDKTLVGGGNFSPRPSRWPIVPGYEVLCELGRGGMGVVYKARQTALGRLVSLKMLRDAYAGPEELARFRREAEAVARLQHPNVVQIYEVGEHDGRPYLALEFVDGGSLDRLLRGRPQPARAAAELLVTLARAVAHAHQQGVVHRDLKPANILLQGKRSTDDTDCTDKKNSSFSSVESVSSVDRFIPKVADFGLAKHLDASGGATTPDGALLGTPGYMAPEQAAGRTETVGPLADVYALGTILYECLSGRPPFNSLNWAEALEQVRAEEPLPPRRLQPSVPRDLESICLKCLEKDPRRRYATAAALADDLQRFLDGKPVLARPAGVLGRAGKWARRRPAVAALVAVSALAVLLLSGGGWWSWLQVRRAAESEATHRQRAEQSFRQALDAVDQMLTEVGAVDLADVPQVEPVRRRLLLKALDFFNDFLKERGDDPAVRFEAARAHGRCGDVLALQGQPEEARSHYDQAVALLERMSAGSEQRRELGRNANNRGALLKKMGRFAEAEADYRRALVLRQGLADEFPDRPECRQELAATHYLLGALLAPQRGRQKEAADDYAAARETQQRLAEDFPDEPEYQRDLARTLNNLGILQWEAGRREADDSFRQAEERQRGLVAKARHVPHYRRELARTLLNRGTLLESRHDAAAARKAFEEARDLLRRLANDYATVPEYRHELAGAYHLLGRLLRDQDQGQEAEAALNTAADLCRELRREVPLEPRYGRELGLVYLDLGILQEDASRLREAEANYRRGLEVQQALADGFREVPGHHNELGCMRETLGSLLARRGNQQDVELLAGLLLTGAARHPWHAIDLPVRTRLAEDTLREARDSLRGAVAEQQLALEQLDAPSPRYQEALRNHYFLLAEVHLQLGGHAAAAEAAQRRLPPFLPARPADYSCAAEFLVRCATLAANDPRLPPDERRAAADGYADRAVDLLEQGLKRPDARPREIDTLIERLRRQESYEPLRARPKFKRLLDEAGKNLRTGVG